MTRMNVLVYADSGAAPAALDHALTSLRSLLSPTYAVHTVKASTLVNEPWESHSALLVFPGGADLQYCRLLNGKGNARIRQFVESGGAYLGLCAGGYYGSKHCDFELGRKGMEVVGERELAFFPGTCRGGAFSGFEYNSELGARAAQLNVVRNNSQNAWADSKPSQFRCYFNGGGIYTYDGSLAEQDIEILASYAETDELAVHGAEPEAAVVCCRVEQGKAILSGPHPEFSGRKMSKSARDIDPEILKQVIADDEVREDFLRMCLEKLGLKANEETRSMPSLTPMYISSRTAERVDRVKRELSAVSEQVDDTTYLRCEADTFRVAESLSDLSLQESTRITRTTLDSMLPSMRKKNLENPQSTSQSGELDETIKDILIPKQSGPSLHDTPKFDRGLFFACLNQSANLTQLGDPLLYGEIVTSTSTILERNLDLTRCLPSGTTFTATQQLSGRGRGTNVWLSPPGSLMFSTVLRHSLKLNNTAPIVFVQYLAAMAVAEGIRSYSPSTRPEQKDSVGQGEDSVRSKRGAQNPYKDIPIRLKWPNDIYVLDPRREKTTLPTNPAAYVKIGGILVNSSYSGGDYTMIVGIGLNVANSVGPTTSLSEVLNALILASTTKNSESDSQNDSGVARDDESPTPAAEPFYLEPLLASILNSFTTLYDEFCRYGFGDRLQQLYYSYWLHSNQEVTVESEPGSPRATVKGITTDWGLLLAEDIRTGRRYALQSDGNRFDFLHGLIGRKV